MKTNWSKRSFAMLSTMLLFAITTHSQWDEGGNLITIGSEYLGAQNSSTVPVRFRHNSTGTISRFEWYTENGTERLTLTNDGKLGLGISSPNHNFQIHEPNAPVNNTGMSITTSVTGSTGTDGLHFHVQPGSTDGADISWYEATPFVINQAGIERMRFDFTGTTTSRITFPLDGSPITNPFSLMHLGGDGVNPLMQRSWMNIGTTYASLENEDLAFFGIHEHDYLQSDAIIAWGCAIDGFFGPDNLTFTFLAPISGSGNPENSDWGLEVGRFTPDGNFGIGNFSPNGLNVQPTEKLDVDGTARFRNIADNADNVLITGTQNAADDYTLSVIEFGGDPDQYLANDGTWQNVPTSVCDWNIVNSNQDLAMGYSGACIPRNVRIGLSNPGARLDIYANTQGTSSTFIASNVKFDGGSGSSFGFMADVNSQSGGNARGIWVSSTGGVSSYGGAFVTSGATSENVGVIGRGSGGVTAIGLYGQGTAACSTATNIIGVYGQATNTGGTCGTNELLAGYFAGAAQQSLAVITLSDASVKTDINDFQDGLGVILDLHPKSYQYIENHDLGLYGQTSIGFLAQDVQEVAPELVAPFMSPLHMDEDGTITQTDMNLLGIKYQEFIPILVKAIQ